MNFNDVISLFLTTETCPYCNEKTKLILNYYSHLCPYINYYTIIHTDGEKQLNIIFRHPNEIQSIFYVINTYTRRSEIYFYPAQTPCDRIMLDISLDTNIDDGFKAVKKAMLLL